MKRLFNLVAKEVSLVTRGANKKKFLITKAHEENQMKKDEIEKLVQMDAATMTKIENVLKSFEKKDDKEPEKTTGGLSDRAQAALKAVARILAPFKEEISDEHLDAVQEELGMKAGKKEEMEKGQQAVPEKEVSKEHSAAAMEEAKKAYQSHLEKLGYKKYPDAEVTQKAKEVLADKEDEEDEEEGDEKVGKGKVAKGMDLSAFPKEQHAQLEEIFKSHNELVQKNVDLEKKLGEERDQRIQKEFTERAATLKNLGADQSELATVLKSLGDKDPELLAKAEKILKAADAQIAAGNLFKEVGTRSAHAPGDAEARLNALVDSVVKKSDGKVTKEQIYEDVVFGTEEGRKLYNEMKNSRKGGA